MKSLLLFRVDGGKVWGISTGHITRMFLLARALDNKYKIIFVMKNYPDGVDFIKDAGFDVETIDTKDEYDATLISLCEKLRPEKVVFDLYSNSYRVFFDYARKKSIQTIVFDVMNNCSGVPDVLINDSLVEKSTFYKHLVGATKLCLGLDYFLLDNPPSVMGIRREVRQIMLTMGGSDPANLTLNILQVLLKINACADCSLNVVLGPLYQEKNEVFALVKNYQQIRVLEAPNNFLDILSKQDMVIIAAGRTLYECAYLGRPAIVAPSIEHESVISSLYAEKTGSINLGLWDAKMSPLKLGESIAAYKSNYALRCSMHTAGRALIDGRGKERILEIFG